MTANGQEERFPELEGVRVPTRLAEAHRWLSCREPSPTAPPEDERHHHALAAHVYRLVSSTEVDARDRALAREWAQSEHSHAELLAARIAVRSALVSYLGPDFDQADPGQHVGGE